MLMQFLQRIQLLVVILYLLKVELCVFIYIMMDDFKSDSDSDRLRGEHRVE